MLRTGLNPYGLAYSLGLQGAGTSRAYLHGEGLDGFLAEAEKIGARTLELDETWLERLDDQQLASLRQRLEGGDMVPILAANLDTANIERLLRLAVALDAHSICLGLTPVTGGDRAAWGARWYELVARVRARLADWSLRAAEHGLRLLLASGEDFTSHELLNLCNEAGPNVGIALDTAASFSVGEAPLAFARAVAPRVWHLRLKDCRVQSTSEGYRLVRCVLGEGAVPLAEIAALFSSQSLTAVLSSAGLDASEVRLFTPGWWRGYAPREAETLAACLLAAQRQGLPPEADHRTPWERGADAELPAYERDQLQRSLASLKALGLMM